MKLGPLEPISRMYAPSFFCHPRSFVANSCAAVLLVIYITQVGSNAWKLRLARFSHTGITLVSVLVLAESFSVCDIEATPLTVTGVIVCIQFKALAYIVESGTSQIKTITLVRRF